MSVCSCCGGGCTSLQLKICLSGFCCRTEACTIPGGQYNLICTTTATITGPGGYTGTMSSGRNTVNYRK
jgi:hypothetical protein